MPAAAVPKVRARSGRAGWAVATALLVATLALAAQLARTRNVRPEPIHAFIDPPPKTRFQLTGDVAAPPVISPDGANIVFGASGKLWIQSLRLGTSTALPGTEAGIFPFWSPDGAKVGFFAGGKLRTAEISGGPAQVLADAPTARGGAWGKSGVIVFAPDYRGGLMRVPAAGGAAKPLSQPDPKMHTTHRWPSFLPDGVHYVYLAADHGNPRSEAAGTYVSSLDGGEPKRLMTSYGSAQAVPGWLLTVRDESLMAVPLDEDRLAVSGSPVRVAAGVNFDYGTWRGVFSASSNARLVFQAEREGGRGQIEWFDVGGKRMNPIGERSESYALRISPDGRRASVLEGDPNNDIWIYDLERGVRTRLTTDALAVMSPVWSADGSELLYVSGATAAGEDYALSRISALGAGQPKVVLRSKERVETTDWSRDGRYALIDKGNISATDIWVYPLAEPDKAFPLVESPVIAGDGRFSPDGRWVAYMSLQSSRFEVYVTAFPATGARWQVSSNGGTDPRWSPDGKTLYFLSLQTEVMAASVDGSGSEFRVKGVETLFPLNVFVGPRISSGFELSPDGRRFLVNSGGDLEVPRVVLISNWTAALPK